MWALPAVRFGTVARVSQVVDPHIVKGARALTYYCLSQKKRNISRQNSIQNVAFLLTHIVGTGCPKKSGRLTFMLVKFQVGCTWSTYTCFLLRILRGIQWRQPILNIFIFNWLNGQNSYFMDQFWTFVAKHAPNIKMNEK